jgi:hypothetical protein
MPLVAVNGWLGSKTRLIGKALRSSAARGVGLGSGVRPTLATTAALSLDLGAEDVGAALSALN